MRPTAVLVLVCLGGFVAAFSGCASSSSSSDAGVVRLSEKMVAEQEQTADQARQHFYRGQYEEAIELLKPLCTERTTSQPLYLCELGSCYLAANRKAEAQEVLLEAYTSLESFLDSTSEKKAVTLWGAEAEKVYKGEPYEQATLSLFMGLLLMEQGDVDNALSCFKNGQFADSDTEEEQFQSDYALLQMLEAKCHQMRQEQDQYQSCWGKALDSFAKTHPYTTWKRRELDGGDESDSNVLARLTAEMDQITRDVVNKCQVYNQPLMAPYSTLLLLWAGKAPVLHRTGEYGENRVIVINRCPQMHFEIKIDDANWYDAIRGYGDVTLQATTRGGREMDNVLASQAAFKKTAHEIGKTFIDAADDASDPRAALLLMGIGLLSHGVGAAANAKADIRCWKTLPDEIAVIPVNLEPGTHTVQIDCYDKHMKCCRSITREIDTDDRPFQFCSLVLPSEEIPPEDPPEPEDLGQEPR